MGSNSSRVMSPLREESSRDPHQTNNNHSNNSTSQNKGAPVSHTSTFTAVNGSSKGTDHTSNESANARHNPRPVERSASSHQNQEQDKRVKASSSPGAGSAYSQASRSRSGSGVGGLSDDGSDLSSSALHSPTTPTSPNLDGQPTSKHGLPQLSKSNQIPFSNPRPSENFDHSSLNKRKRTSTPPNPHPPHPRTDNYTAQEMSVTAENAIAQVNQIKNDAELLASSGDNIPDQKDTDVSAEAREQLTQYARRHLQNESSAISNRLDRGESIDGQSQNSDLIMLDSQPSQLQGPSQQLSQEQHHEYDGPSTPGGIQMANGVRNSDGKRKRVFSNRTKTGCVTCRRRKKKCDEEKPECKCFAIVIIKRSEA